MNGATTKTVSGYINNAEADEIGPRCARRELTTVNVPVRVRVRPPAVAADDSMIRAIRRPNGHTESNRSKVVFAVAFPKFKAAALRTFNSSGQTSATL